MQGQLDVSVVELKRRLYVQEVNRVSNKDEIASSKRWFENPRCVELVPFLSFLSHLPLPIS
jgi:hypothetical protein